MSRGSRLCKVSSTLLSSIFNGLLCKMVVKFNIAIHRKVGIAIITCIC